MCTHLWNLLNLHQNLYQKLLMSSIVVDVIWKSLKNTHNVHMNEGQGKYLKNMFIRHNIF
jgi:hypothetical protein